MQSATIDASEAAILGRVLDTDVSGMSEAAARVFLALDFTEADKGRMRQLSAKAREGSLSPVEQAEVNSYERVGHFLGILQSKARRALKPKRGTKGDAKGG